MIKTIEDLAEVSVARGCGFAGLGIVCLMVGLSDQMSVACKAGGILTLGACMILAIRGWTATTTPYKRTEVWIMLDKAERPQPAIAQQVIGTALREAYLRFALHAAWLSTGLLVIAIVWSLARGGS